MLLKIFILTCLVLCSSLVMAEKRVGGISPDEKPVTTDVENLVQSLRANIVSMVNAECTKQNKNVGCTSSDLQIIPKTYKSQVVAGMNYFVKAEIKSSGSAGYTSFWLLRIYERPWDNYKEVTRVKGPVEETAEITYF